MKDSREEYWDAGKTAVLFECPLRFWIGKMLPQSLRDHGVMENGRTRCMVAVLALGCGEWWHLEAQKIVDGERLG